MTFAELANPGVLTQPVYEPGKPIETVARELGLDPAGIIKLASNENPLRPVAQGARGGAARAARSDTFIPTAAISRCGRNWRRNWGWAWTSLSSATARTKSSSCSATRFSRPGAECVMHRSAFIVYKLVTLMFGAKPVEVPLAAGLRQDLPALLAAITPRTSLVFLASPTNPTGAANTAAEIAGARAGAAAARHSGVRRGVRGIFWKIAPDLRPLIAEGRKVICLRTFSKIYGLASLRVGYGYAAPELIAMLQRVRQPFNVNAIAAAAAVAALDDDEFVGKCRRENRAGLVQLGAGFTASGWSLCRHRGISCS